VSCWSKHAGFVNNAAGTGAYTTPEQSRVFSPVHSCDDFCNDFKSPKFSKQFPLRSAVTTAGWAWINLALIKQQNKNKTAREESRATRFCHELMVMVHCGYCCSYVQLSLQHTAAM